MERDLIYRSHILNTLTLYLQQVYSPLIGKFEILDKVREDSAILEVFMLILARRLTVIDDLEFQGKQRSTFLTLKQS